MTYIDLLITNDDLTLDADGLPVFVGGRDSIEQDIRHAVRESGYLVAMIAERSSERRRLFVQRIVRLVEEDRRIVPGTVTMAGTGVEGEFLLSATTVDFGNVELVI